MAYVACGGSQLMSSQPEEHLHQHLRKSKHTGLTSDVVSVWSRANPCMVIPLVIAGEG